MLLGDVTEFRRLVNRVSDQAENIDFDELRFELDRLYNQQNPRLQPRNQVPLVRREMGMVS